MSNSPPGPTPPPTRMPRRMLTGLVFFGAGLLLVGVAVVFVVLQLVESNPIALIPGAIAALVGIALNFTGLVLIYRAMTGTGTRNTNEPDDTP